MRVWIMRGLFGTAFLLISTACFAADYIPPGDMGETPPAYGGPAYGGPVYGGPVYGYGGPIYRGPAYGAPVYRGPAYGYYGPRWDHGYGWRRDWEDDDEQSDNEQ